MAKNQISRLGSANSVPFYRMLADAVESFGCRSSIINLYLLIHFGG